MPFAFVFPGQGSQSIGMLARLAAAEPQAPEAGQGAMATIAVERAIEVLKSKGAKRAIKLPVSASLAQTLAACRSHS